MRNGLGSRDPRLEEWARWHPEVNRGLPWDGVIRGEEWRHKEGSTDWQPWTGTPSGAPPGWLPRPSPRPCPGPDPLFCAKKKRTAVRLFIIQITPQRAPLLQDAPHASPVAALRRELRDESAR